MISTMRLGIAALLVAAIHGGYCFIHQQGLPTEVRLPTRDLAELPKRLGVWEGKEEEVPPELVTYSEADCMVNREYRDGRGNTANLHAAVYRGPQLALPHHPIECSKSAGYRIANEKSVKLLLENQSTVDVRLLAIERDGAWEWLLYWYHFGDDLTFDRDTLRKAVWGLRGHQTLPPKIKVFIQMPGHDADEAERTLQDLGRHVFAWTKQL